MKTIELSVPIENILAQLGISVVTVGTEISAHCPFHVDSHPSFSMNATTYLWICYQCGESGSLPMLLKKVGGEGTNTTELLREVRHRSVGKDQRLKEVEPEVVVTPPDPVFVYAQYESFRWPPDWALHDRMINRPTIERYGVRWNQGWVIPIWSPVGNHESDDLWGWQFKRMDVVRNYPKAVKKSQTLFGLSELTSASVVLVESPLDVTRLASVGISAVAAYGAFVSRAQLRLLVEVADRIILALDNDVEGIRQTKKLYPYLAKFVPTSKPELPAKDPGELDDEQVMEIFG